MRYKVSYVDQGEEGWMASIYTLPGCHTEGPTREAAREKLWGALHHYLDDVSEAELVDETEWTEPSCLVRSAGR